MRTYRYSYRPKGWGCRTWATKHTYKKSYPRSSNGSGILASMIAKLIYNIFF